MSQEAAGGQRVEQGARIGEVGAKKKNLYLIPPQPTHRHKNKTCYRLQEGGEPAGRALHF